MGADSSPGDVDGRCANLFAVQLTGVIVAAGIFYVGKRGVMLPPIARVWRGRWGW